MLSQRCLLPVSKKSYSSAFFCSVFKGFSLEKEAICVHSSTDFVQKDALHNVKLYVCPRFPSGTVNRRYIAGQSHLIDVHPICMYFSVTVMPQGFKIFIE